MEKQISKQGHLAKVILKECQRLEVKDPDEVAELIGGASLIILNILGEYLNCPFEEMKAEYIRAMKGAKIAED